MLVFGSIVAALVGAAPSPSFSISPLFPITQGLAPYADPSPPRLAKGEMRVSSALTWTNSLRVDDGNKWPGYALIVDGETLVNRSSMAVGIGSGLALGMWYEASAIFPGFMDPAISAFHHAFDFANQWRDSVPPNLLDIWVVTPAGTLTDLNEAGLGLDSLGFGMGWNVSRDWLPSLDLKVKVPVSSPSPWIFGNLPSVEFSSAWAFSWRWIDWKAALGLAWQAFPSTFSAIPHREWLPQASSSLFLTIAPGLSLGAEAAAMASPYAIDEWYLGGLVGNVWAGMSAQLSPSLRIDTAIIEELASWASIEVGFQAGLTWNGEIGLID